MTPTNSTSVPLAGAPLASNTALERSQALAMAPQFVRPRATLPRSWLAAGLLALAGVAGAAYWAGRSTPPGNPASTTTNAANLPAPLYGPGSATAGNPAAPAPLANTGTGGHGSSAIDPAATPSATPTATGTPVAHSGAPVCKQCGVVESVQAVQHKGQASGVGAVAGGVLGGVLGNQVGKGNGRTAMTVLGAVGGGLAGNEVEKRHNATTSYRVQVRTDSGTVRTVEQATAPAVGQRVRIEGGKLHAIAP